MTIIASLFISMKLLQHVSSLHLSLIHCDVYCMSVYQRSSFDSASKWNWFLSRWHINMQTLGLICLINIETYRETKTFRSRFYSILFISFHMKTYKNEMIFVHSSTFLQKESSFPKHHVPFEFMSSLKYIFLSKNKLTKAFSFHFSCCVLDPRIINSQNIFTWFTFLKDTLERRKRRCSLYHHTHTFSHVGYVETQKSLMCWTFMSM